MTYRIKCASCGAVMNVNESGKCAKCGADVNIDQPGMLKVYRMGNVVGVAVGFGLYLNDQPIGHIGNKETVCIPLPYGTYKLHCRSAGMSKKCKDITFTLSPEETLVCAKVYIKMGFWRNSVVPERVEPSDMPE